MIERIRIAKEKRRNHSDNFRDENGYSWDIVFVFKVYGDKEKLNEYQSKYSLKRVMRQLADGGLQTRLFYSVQVSFGPHCDLFSTGSSTGLLMQADEVYCKVRAPIHRLKKEADRIDMKLKLNSERLRALCKSGRPVCVQPSHAIL